MTDCLSRPTNAKTVDLFDLPAIAREQKIDEEIKFYRDRLKKFNLGEEQIFKASTVAVSFLNTWIARFGVPLYVVTDRGAQFESEPFQELSSLTGFHRLKTTSYHPQVNGMIER